MKKLLLISFIFCFSHTFSQGWFPVGNGLPGSEVYVLYNFDSVLYAGGALYVQGMSGIGQWNGSTWAPLGKGINGGVYAIIVYNGKVYMGGNFDSAGGKPANRIAVWDGHNWAPVGLGMGAIEIDALAIYNGELYAGGYFSSADGKPVNNIAKWNGTTWDSVGKGTGSGIYVMQVYNGKLYVGGTFYSAGGIPLYSLATWDGTKWDSVKTWDSCNTDQFGNKGTVHAFSIHDSLLYMGGFTPTMNNICQWNDTAFKTPDFGANLPVNALIEKNGLIYAGGQFDSAGHISANEIAVWNGSSWSTLGSGMSGDPFSSAVYSLAFYNGALYAAGEFNRAGGYNNVNNIAVWGDSTLGVNTIKANEPITKVYPNPSNGLFNIEVSGKEQGISEIQVYNVLGEKVFAETLPQGQNSNAINLTGQPNGIYLYRVLQENGELIGEGKIIIQH